MSGHSIKRASLAEIEAMNEKGDLFHDPDAPEGESLGAEFWARAELIEPRETQPVLLKVDRDVIAFFKSQGKGHLTRMQNVLRAYVNAHRNP